jgi:hypothetical protein
MIALRIILTKSSQSQSVKISDLVPIRSHIGPLCTLLGPAIGTCRNGERLTEVALI